MDIIMNKKMLATLISLLLVTLSGCGNDKGDHGSRKQVELLLKGGGSVILVCPEFDRAPLGDHGRECYLKKEN